MVLRRRVPEGAENPPPLESTPPSACARPTGTENRKEGTFGCSPVPKIGTRVHSPKTTLLRNDPFVSSRIVGACADLRRNGQHIGAQLT